MHWLSQFLHPGGSGYWWWSGIGSDIGEITLLAVAYGFFRLHNCHYRGCPRVGRLSDDKSGTKWCYKHAPEFLRDQHPHRKVHWP